MGVTTSHQTQEWLDVPAFLDTFFTKYTKQQVQSNSMEPINSRIPLPPPPLDIVTTAKGYQHSPNGKLTPELVTIDISNYSYSTSPV